MNTLRTPRALRTSQRSANTTCCTMCVRPTESAVRSYQYRHRCRYRVHSHEQGRGVRTGVRSKAEKLSSYALATDHLFAKEMGALGPYRCLLPTGFRTYTTLAATRASIAARYLTERAPPDCAAHTATGGWRQTLTKTSLKKIGLAPNDDRAAAANLTNLESWMAMPVRG